MKRTWIAAVGALMLTACTQSIDYMPPIQVNVVGIGADSHAAMVLNYDKNGMVTPFAEISRLGLVTSIDSASVWTAISDGESYAIRESYDMLIGKSLHCENNGIETTYLLKDGQGHEQQLEVRAYADGVVFRYVLGKGYENPVELKGENTKLQMLFDKGCNRWLSRWTEPYEDFFPLNPEEKDDAHWGYPALFNPRHNGEQEDLYVLLTEANVLRGHSASSFYTDNREGAGYRIQPDEMVSQVQTGWASPWRVLIVGDLNTVVQSTLVTDVSEPCTYEDTSWIKPGVVSWIYWAYNHGSQEYDLLCLYVDLAKEMGWPYSLVDAEWDVMRGGTIEDVAAYAKKNGIKPLLWYNSTTGWFEEHGAPSPSWRLNTAEAREKEFTWMNEQGFVGAKVDFFRDDESEQMNYCIDILEDAARHKLLMNLHGGTMQRGWQRTYPNLVTMESVYGAEWYNNVPTFTAKAARHNATLPFTRNVVGSMDYTPGTFTDSQHPHITTHGHELALTVLFESGVQHMPDRPSAYLEMPSEVKDILKTLPTAWDQTLLLAGYPGESAVIARQHNGKWYIAGINGTDEPKDLSFSVERLGTPSTRGLLICDGETQYSFDIKLLNIPPLNVTEDSKTHEVLSQSREDIVIPCAPRGGFLYVL